MGKYHSFRSDYASENPLGGIT
jgi:hypothetical protein